MSDIVHEGMNNFRIVKVELGDDKDWKDRYQVKAFPDFGVFVNGEYHPYSGQKEAGYTNCIVIIHSDILQFAVKYTEDGILRIAHQAALKYLKENSNAVNIGLVKEGVGTYFVHCMPYSDIFHFSHIMLILLIGRVKKSAFSRGTFFVIRTCYSFFPIINSVMKF